MTDQSMDPILRRAAERAIVDATPPTLSPAVRAHVHAARREDRTWLGRRRRDFRARLGGASVVVGVARQRPLLGVAAPLLIGAAVVGAIAVGSQRSGPGPDRPASSAALPAPSVALAPSPTADAREASGPPSVSASGSVVLSTNGRLVVVRSDGSDRQMLTDGSVDDFFPAWSPDGRRIAFFSQDCVSGERCPDKVVDSSLVVINADGTDRRVLRTGLQNPLGLRWLPDGSGVIETAFRSTGNAVRERVNLDGSIGRAADDPPAPAFVAPDGSAVIELDDQGRIGIADADGSNDRVLVSPPDSSRVLPIGWTPDGRSIAYLVEPRRLFPARETWLIAKDGTGAHRWSGLPEDGQLLGWSPDRRWMLLEVLNGSDEIDHYVLADADGSSPRDLDPGFRSVGWTRDGARLMGFGDLAGDPRGLPGSVVILDPAGALPPVPIQAPGLLGWDWLRNP